MTSRGNITLDQIRPDQLSAGTDAVEFATADGSAKTAGTVAVWDANGNLTGSAITVPIGIDPFTTHSELLTDGAGNPILANGDFIYVLGVPN